MPLSSLRSVRQITENASPKEVRDVLRELARRNDLSGNASVTTTDATTTVIWTDELPPNSVVQITAEIGAITSGATSRARYIRRASFGRPGSGAAVLDGAVSAVFTAESDSAWNATIAVSSTAGYVEVQVTGAAATSIQWTARITALVTTA